MIKRSVAITGVARLFLLAFLSTTLMAISSWNAIAETPEKPSGLDFDPTVVLDEVANLVTEHFYDRNFDPQAWQQKHQLARQKALAANNLDQFSSEVNQLLTYLQTSHTHYYSRHDPRRYQLLGVFHKMYPTDQTELFIYDGIGIYTQTIDDQAYLSAVFDGHPAAAAGLQFGDKILSVDGDPFHPIASFQGKAGKTSAVTIERDGAELTLSVEVAKLDGRTIFESAMTASQRVITHRDKKIGYIHAWSYSGQRYQDILENAVLWGELNQCDSLVLDLRDGWGGASPGYLNLFREPIMAVRSIPRSGPEGSYSGVWGKPVALLTNAGSTSGKELYTYGFKKLGLGKIFGETTAGAVVAGRAFLLSNGDLLYLAVNDVYVDGNRLEGVGVAPDVEVPRRLPLDTQSGTDPQLEAALDHLAEISQASS